MRAMWKGSVSFGLVNVPVSLYTATRSHDIRFHQVHASDGGRIRYRRVCELDGNQVDYSEIAKGYEYGGEMVMLTDEDFENLPLSSSKEIEVNEFVDMSEIDPLLLDKSYYLEPDTRAVKPYVLLRDALESTDRAAIVTVALRQRESLALLRVRGKAIVLQTMLWPDEVRAADFDVLDTDVELKDSERQMAGSLVDSLSTEFDPDAYEDRYAAAVRDLVDAKLEGNETFVREEASEDTEGEVIDLMAALRESVDSEKNKRRSEPADSSEERTSGSGGSGGSQKSTTKTKSAGKQAGSKKSTSKTSGSKSAGTTSGSAKKSGGTKTSAKKTPAKTTTAKTTTAKKSPAKKSPAKKSPAKKKSA